MAETAIFQFPQALSSEVTDIQPLVPITMGRLDPVVVQKALEATQRGVSHRAGGFRLNPNEHTIEKQGVGLYKVTHNLGKEGLVLSLALLVQPGTFTVVEHTPTYFVVQTALEKVPTDLDFSYSISQVVPLQARQA